MARLKPYGVESPSESSSEYSGGRLSKSRLDRFISAQLGVNRGAVRLMLAKKQILVDGLVASDIAQQIDQFSHISILPSTTSNNLSGEQCEDRRFAPTVPRVLQNNARHYLMMNKPIGVVSATTDKQHKTVIDLLSQPDRGQLHIAGRLDLNSSGLLLLTNDGRWSRLLSAPESAVCKRYRVTLQNPISEAYVDAFSEGMFFSYEGITTKPVTLTIVSDFVAELSLEEGRYHQIKRMFGRFRNPVLGLHRFAIGGVTLDEQLAPGESRVLTEAEVQCIVKNTPP